jgi:SAM-dependent methyltransferase
MSAHRKIFDRALVRERRDRAAVTIEEFDFLFRAAAEQLLERLALVKKPLPVVLDLGGAHGILSELLRQRSGTTQVVSSDLSFNLLARTGNSAVVADEEFLPFRDGSFDAVVSALSLQWVNDLPAVFAQLRQILKPDGVLMLAMLGGNSLHELRACLMEAELAVTGGASPRIAPFAEMRDVGGLLQRAGFALPVVDSETVTVEYSNALALMHDLQGMGAGNALCDRLKLPLRREVLARTSQLYQEKFAQGDGLIPATFEIIYAIGWSPHASQPQPLPRGSAKNRLVDFVGKK